MTRIGIIGSGYWGPNLIRNFQNLPESQVAAVCDLSSRRLNHARELLPDTFLTEDVNELLNPELIDAAVISTPTKTHYALAKQALERGLHTFVEKPLATSANQGQELIDLAEKNGVILFVGHLFLYNAAVNKLKDLVSTGELGNLCYISSSRLNLGPIRQDVNALWDLAPHDIYIILELISETPVGVNCQGLAYLNSKVHDVCSLTLHFEHRRMATIHVSWLNPNKTRLMTVVGEKKMAIYDDMEPLEKIKIYDKRIEAPRYTDSFGEFQFSFRYGDTSCPWLEQSEPLKLECQHFLDSVVSGEQPKTDGKNGLDVIKVLSAASTSLHEQGGYVQV